MNASTSGLSRRPSTDFPATEIANLDERAVGVNELAAYLGVSTQTAYVYAKSGQIPGFKVGRLWRFYLSDVRAQLTKPKDPWANSSPSRGRRRRS